MLSSVSDGSLIRASALKYPKGLSSKAPFGGVLKAPFISFIMLTY